MSVLEWCHPVHTIQYRDRKCARWTELVVNVTSKANIHVQYTVTLGSLGPVSPPAALNRRPIDGWDLSGDGRAGWTWGGTIVTAAYRYRRLRTGVWRASGPPSVIEHRQDLRTAAAAAAKNLQRVRLMGYCLQESSLLADTVCWLIRGNTQVAS